MLSYYSVEYLELFAETLSSKLIVLMTIFMGIVSSFASSMINSVYIIFGSIILQFEFLSGIFS